jgi:hypothetical protein
VVFHHPLPVPPQLLHHKDYLTTPVDFQHLKDTDNPSDKLTKLSDGPGHNTFAMDILGHHLLSGVKSILVEAQYQPTAPANPQQLSITT